MREARSSASPHGLLSRVKFTRALHDPLGDPREIARSDDAVRIKVGLRVGTSQTRDDHLRDDRTPVFEGRAFACP